MKIIGDQENLKNEIIEDAQRKKKQAIKKAEYEAEKIIKDAEDKAESEYNEIKIQAEQKAEKAKEQILSSIPAAIKKKNITMMNKIVDEVMDKLYNNVKSLDKKSIKQLELNLLDEAILKLEQGTYTVNICPESTLTDKDLKPVEKKYNVKLKLKENKELSLGVLISGEHDRMHLDNTVQGKIKRDIEEVRYIIYHTLFSDIQEIKTGKK
jgi:vacuolar-type H+-ATPase subunit E/Vma4